MSEQPPRASSHVPYPGEPIHEGLEPDPDAPDTEYEAEIRAARPYAPDPEERIRARTGDGLDRVADAARRIGHRAREQGGLVGQAEPIAYRVGDSLQSAASYVRGHDVVEMRDDLELGVRRSPIKALAVAALGGFLLGRLIR